jgi:hypothetical protein
MPHSACQVRRNLLVAAGNGDSFAASTGPSPDGDLQTGHAAMTRLGGQYVTPTDGIMLSDGEGQGERAPSRRYGAGPGWRRWLCEQHPNGYSVAPMNRRGALEFGRAVGRRARVVCDAQQDPGMVRKLQLAIFENLLYFLEIYCQFLIASVG